MKATVNVLCYKSKTLANGENPLVIRVCTPTVQVPVYVSI